jgi:hypothetical protein
MVGMRLSAAEAAGHKVAQFVGLEKDEDED